jgi:AraC-like DNA-binding protein
MSNIRHEEWCVLICCFSGHADYRIDDVNLHVGPGDVLFFPPRTERSVRSDPEKPWHYGSIVFSLREDQGLSVPEIAALIGPNPIRASKEVATLFSDAALRWAQRSAGYALRCAGILSDLIGRLSEESKDHDLSSRIPNYSRIKKALAIIERAPRDAHLGRIADQVGLSESRFRHLFKAVTGLSPTRYVNARIVLRARDLLVSGEYNVSETAEELGFENVYYFSRLFKAIAGQSPSTFLKK